ncbi:phage replisome organizer, putative, N-terminal region [Dehalogenimonas alkenigignens]|uniref:Phage replisome organizer, putative, N-terminal region n=1 Tax=Dehalogenimonas alkenigignens TaxID=1217799 RepID=A0A0W0GHV8_9CHLR|nr:phage replisome organizer N-terminal domain-containing protein [Dehalogenimonas alkenigignens]KTB48131.1 phage replisome organizer, putative, N-terminal region [Dehalogenimonas alkenigignens]
MANWIMLHTCLLQDDKVAIIESKPNGTAMAYLWVKLLLLAGKVNNGGLIYLAEGVPYDDETLSAVTHFQPQLVREAMKLFHDLKMIEVHEGVICLNNWDKYQSKRLLTLHEKEARGKRQQRAEKKLLVTKIRQNLLPEIGLSVDTSTDSPRTPLIKRVEERVKENKTSPLPPKGSDDDDDDGIIRFYESQTGRSVAPGIAETLKDLTAKYGAGKVRESIKVAALAEARNPVRYMAKTLENGLRDSACRGNGGHPKSSSNLVVVN